MASTDCLHELKPMMNGAEYVSSKAQQKPQVNGSIPGRTIKHIPDASFNLTSLGLKLFKNGFFGSNTYNNSNILARFIKRTFSTIAGGTLTVTGAIATIATSLIVKGLHLKSANSLFRAGRVEDPQSVFSVSRTEGKDIKGVTDKPASKLKLFQLNASLGHGFVSAWNHGGTEFGKMSSKERADEIVAAILTGESNLVTLQEVFDPDMGDYISEQLSEEGYTVFYQKGDPIDGGLVRYNSGLLTAVKKNANIQIEEAGYRMFNVDNPMTNENYYAAKGVMAVRVKVNDQTMILANTHLQNNGSQEVAFRNQEMEQAQQLIKDMSRGVKHQVILAGDMNCFDHGVSQADAWARGSRFEGNEGFVKRLEEGYDDNYQMPSLSCDTASIEDLMTDLTSQGSGVQGATFHSTNEKIKGKIKAQLVRVQGKITDKNRKIRFLQEFFKRHQHYKFKGSVAIKGKNVNEEVNKVLDLHIKNICNNRGDNVPSLSSLKEKIALTLKIRDRQELISEAVISHLYKTNDAINYNVPKNLKALMQHFNKMSDEDLIEAISTNISQLIEEEPKGQNANQQLAMELSLMKNVQYKYYERNRNDRVFTKGFESASYEMDMANRHLSDHVPLKMVIQLDQK